ncbi:hypothetical protein ANN_10704 [Periplaneta americana]|uniref:Tc1-like transposase DDE domain-containing protein n=1 Tax=Periplaneta americana TaxID=6978 RepID=A0ABQ8T4Q5_PERAM|nr:hypothetical protein ANN_10704 [Periplaneta americana]
MITWLRNKRFTSDESMRKGTIYKLVQVVKPKRKLYRIDSHLQSLGHTEVRLPPYNCDLSAIELAWAKVKSVVREGNMTGGLSFQKLRGITLKAIDAVTKTDWEAYCRHVQKLEEEYWKKDSIVTDVIDIMDISGDSSSGSEKSKSGGGGGGGGGEDDDDEEEEEEEVQLSDSQLTTPLH